MINIIINIFNFLIVINSEMLQNECSRAKGHLTIVEHFNNLNFLSIVDNLTLINLICFITGILTVLLNRNNLLITLIGVELVLLSANMIFILGSFINNDPQGLMYVLCILTVSAVETGLGVAVLVFAYGTISNTNYSRLNNLKS